LLSGTKIEIFFNYTQKHEKIFGDTRKGIIFVRMEASIKKAKTQAPLKDKTVKVDGHLYQELSGYVEAAGMKINAFVNMAVREKLKRDKK
jgi:hypothetical protein